MSSEACPPSIKYGSSWICRDLCDLCRRDTLVIWNFDTMSGDNRCRNGLSIPWRLWAGGPTFKPGPAPTAGGRGWIIDASLFKEARNIGEASGI
jgi:hypothetical protein